MRRNSLRIAMACALVLTGIAACGTGSGGAGSGKSISIWEGFTGAESKAFGKQVKAYEKANPGVSVSILYVNNDNTLQKVLTAVRGGTTPDIAYLYGSWAPNVAQIPQVVNLTNVVTKPSVNWNDFWVGERDVATVNGKVIGIPALVDNLAVVYNKALFAKAGLAAPSPDWTWSQFVADARARFGGAGEYLFGRFSAADCMYAPVVLRFRTYDVDLPPDCRAYCDAMLALPAMQEWIAAAEAETEVLEQFEPCC